MDPDTGEHIVFNNTPPNNDFASVNAVMVSASNWGNSGPQYVDRSNDVLVADFVTNSGKYVSERSVGIVGEPTLIDDAPPIPIGLLPQGVDQSSVFGFKDQTGTLFYGMRMPDGKDVAKQQSLFFPGADGVDEPDQPFRVEVSGVVDPNPSAGADAAAVQNTGGLGGSRTIWAQHGERCWALSRQRMRCTQGRLPQGHMARSGEPCRASRRTT